MSSHPRLSSSGGRPLHRNASGLSDWSPPPRRPSHYPHASYGSRSEGRNSSRTHSQRSINVVQIGHTESYGHKTHRRVPISYSRAQSPLRMACCSIVLSIAFAFALLVPTAFLIVYVTVWTSARLEGSWLVTGAAATTILEISNSIPKVSEFLMVPLMSLCAYIVAGKWWMDSRCSRSGSLPTPIQYGMVANVLGAPNYRSLFQAWRLWAGQGSAERHRAVRIPGYLLATIALLSWILVLHHGISMTDWAIHFVITPTEVILPVSHSQAAEYGHSLLSRPFNDSKCAQWRSEQADAVLGYVKDSCGIFPEGFNNQEYVTLPEALRTLSNSSEHHMSVWTNDGTAIMVSPTQQALSISYAATSVGIHATCEAITNRCVKCHTSTFEDTTYETCTGGPNSSEARLEFACPTVNTTVGETHKRQYGAPTNGHIADIIDPATGAPLEGNADDFRSWLAPSNPFRFVFEAETFAYALYGNATSHNFIESTGFIQWGHRGALGVFDCTVAAYRVDYSFQPPNVYTILRKELAPLNQTEYLSYGLPVADDITNIVRGTGFDNTTMSFADAAALQISRQTIGNSATLYDQQEALQILGTPVMGSRLPLIPFLILVVLTVALALTILLAGIAACSVILRAQTAAIGNVRSRLLDPYRTVVDAYGRPFRKQDDVLSADPFLFFAPSSDRQDRLSIGEQWTGELWDIGIRRSGNVRCSERETSSSWDELPGK